MLHDQVIGEKSLRQSRQLATDVSFIKNKELFLEEKQLLSDQQCENNF